MKKLVVIGLFALVLAGIFSACNTYQRCPAYTDNAPVETVGDRI